MALETLPAPRDGAELIRRTVDLLAQRAPSILADAARELGLERLVLRFTDGSQTLLQADHNALRVHPAGIQEPTVECLLSDASLRRAEVVRQSANA